MYYLNEIDKYILNHSSGEDPVLTELNRETYLKALNARMISGHPQGILLEIISKLVNPESVLEIGTYTGYSAICLAKGLKPGGFVYTIEMNDELEPFHKKYFKRSGLADRIKVFTGDALKIIPEMHLTFDLIFIDADKQNYPQFYNLVIDKLRPGGIILADNVLWNGKVIDPNESDDPETKAIIKFNEMVKSDNRVEVIIIPLRDGISLIRKI